MIGARFSQDRDFLDSANPVQVLSGRKDYDYPVFRQFETRPTQLVFTRVEEEEK